MAVAAPARAGRPDSGTLTFSSRLRQPRLAALWLAALFVVTLPAVTVRFYASDEVQYFAYLRSLWFDRDVSFDNEYRTLYDRGVARSPGFRETFLEPTTATGLRINFGTLGPAILWSPFYALADGAVILGRAFGATVPRDGYSWPYLAAVCYGSALYGFLAVLLSARLARKLTGAGHAQALAVWLGTPLLFYMYLAAGMAHAVSAFAVALMLSIWLEVRKRWRVRGALALGAAAGLIAMVREQDTVLLVGPLVDYAIAARRRIKEQGFRADRELPVALAGIAAFALVYVPQILVYLELNGRPGPSPLVTRKMNWISPHALEVLLSPQHGFLFWTPLAALALGGLFLLPGKDPAVRVTAPAAVRPIARALLLAVAGHIYISGSVESWTVAGAFGQRRFVAVTPMLVVGLAALWHRARSRRSRLLLWTAVSLMIWWNLGLMALFGTRMMDRQRLELGPNAYDVFVTVPRAAPELAWRYLTDRDSLYEQRVNGR